MPTVVIIQEHLPDFRVEFYQKLRDRLESFGIDLKLVYAPNQKNTFLKGNLDWAIGVPIRWFGPFGWQPVFRLIKQADLVIIQQETKYMINPFILLLAKFGYFSVAYWGHGRNFQAADTKNLSFYIKKFFATKVQWWFAYNDLSAAVVQNFGFPKKRITSVGNAVNTKGLIERKNSLSTMEIEAVRSELNLYSNNVAIFTGGLYPNKKIDFLIESAILVRDSVPDFELIVIGDGPDRDQVSKAVSKHKWIHYVGPKNDEAKVPYWAIAKLLLMPGLVGLVIVDSFALGVPLITTDFPYHSPEINYLKNDINGMLINCEQSSKVYASAIVELLLDPERIERLKIGALQSSGSHTIENMVANFSDGVIKALRIY